MSPDSNKPEGKSFPVAFLDALAHSLMSTVLLPRNLSSVLTVYLLLKSDGTRLINLAQESCLNRTQLALVVLCFRNFRRQSCAVKQTTV